MRVENGIKTFTANGALGAHVRVKLTAASSTSPPQVEVAGAGEQHIGITEYAAATGTVVAVRLRQAPGTQEAKASKAIAVGDTIYGAAAGKVSDASSGTAIGKAVTAATADGDIIEIIDFTVVSTTAATVSIADAGGFTAQTTVEAALAEIYQHIVSAQGFVPIPLTSWMIGDGTNSVSFGGPATDPILDMANGDADSALRWLWAAASVEEIICQIPLPPDLDTTADLVLHLRTAKNADANTVTLASDCYFNEGDTKVEDVTGTIAQAAGETTITIAAADIPDGAQTLTVELTPSAHAGDILYLYATWLEYTRKVLTA